MIVSLLGIVISLFAYLIAFPDPNRRRFDIYAALLAVHLVAAVAYWLMSFEDAVDAFMYYRDPFGFIREDPFESGTFFVVHFVQGIRNTLGGSFLDHFLFFQCFGMIGIALLIRIFNEIADSFGMNVPLHVYFILFLPGLHFWTAMIGKDGLIFMAAILAIWSAMHIKRRIVWAVVAIGLMVLIRPHIAAIATGSIVGALFISKQLKIHSKAVLAPLALIGLVFVFAKVSQRFDITLDPESLSDFIEGQQSQGTEDENATNITQLPYPIRIWTLLFRPFFIDQPGMMSQIVSAENAVLLAMFSYIAWHWKLLVSLCKNVFYMAYCAIYAPVLIALLALVNYNIGLGLRQKMMAIPGVLVIFATIVLYKRYLAAISRAQPLQPVAEKSTSTAPAAV